MGSGYFSILVQCRYFYTGDYFSILVQCRYFYTGGYFSILVMSYFVWCSVLDSSDLIFFYHIL